ncbi:MAG: DUF934 domain-containing protein [Rhodobacteraceae bacterium]|nr:DUF934 domain-containing protein [Paracoccaceae bacterium]
MSVIVTDQGFAADDWPANPTPLEASGHDPAQPVTALDLPGDTPPEALEGQLAGLTHIRIAIPGFADGRGLTLARQLRRMGYRGRLRAQGPLIADQYGMARRAGFDEVEIPCALAERQPESDWLARADWRAPSYQARLQG